LVCLISYGYIKMLGSEGLTNATKAAILNANYIKDRLKGNFNAVGFKWSAINDHFVGGTSSFASIQYIELTF